MKVSAPVRPFYWKQVTDQLFQLGALILHKNGNYQVGSVEIDQQSSVEAMQLPGARIDKRPGVGEELKYAVAGKGTLVAKYESNSWWILVRDA